MDTLGFIRNKKHFEKTKPPIKCILNFEILNYRIITFSLVLDEMKRNIL